MLLWMESLSSIRGPSAFRVADCVVFELKTRTAGKTRHREDTLFSVKLKSHRASNACRPRSPGFSAWNHTCLTDWRGGDNEALSHLTKEVYRELWRLSGLLPQLLEVPKNSVPSWMVYRFLEASAEGHRDGCEKDEPIGVRLRYRRSGSNDGPIQYDSPASHREIDCLSW
jgi:hypothetical protein